MTTWASTSAVLEHLGITHRVLCAFKTGLSRLGVQQDVRDFLVGHHRGVDEHYLDTFAQAREAVKLIPALTTTNVRTLSAREG